MPWSADGPGPRISVLIGTHDRLDALLVCLSSIHAQSLQDFEILVLDDGGPTPGLEAALARTWSGPDLRVFRSVDRLGVAGGRNFLAARAKGDLLVFLDDDAKLSSEHDLEQISRILNEEPDEVACLALKILDYRPSGIRVLAPFPRRVRRRRPDVLSNSGRVSYFHGGGHAIRRHVFEELGGYQPNLVFYGEELDLAYRIVNSGRSILFVPSVVVQHYPDVSDRATPEERRFRLYHAARNTLWIGRRYLPWPNVVVYCLVWTSRFFLNAVRQRMLVPFLRGVYAGLFRFEGTAYDRMSPSARRYLREHYGRLWY